MSKPRYGIRVSGNDIPIVKLPNEGRSAVLRMPLHDNKSIDSLPSDPTTIRYAHRKSDEERLLSQEREDPFYMGSN